jgi:hypothetical protein
MATESGQFYRVDLLKSQGLHTEAGHLARRLGYPCWYGCHFGMRSNRESARLDFESGWTAEDRALQTGEDAY